MNPPDADYTEDAYRFRWPEHGVEVEFSRFIEGSETVTAEALAGVKASEQILLIKRTRINLVTDTGSRLAFQKACAIRIPGLDWPAMLEQAIFLALERWRTGEPPLDLTEIEPSSKPRWLVAPYVERVRPTVAFGPGGGGKSMFALAVTVLVATGQGPIGTLEGEQAPVLYLDWEDDGEAHAERLRAICTGADLALPARGRVLYRSMAYSFIHALSGIQAIVRERGIGLVVVDSMAAARGASGEGSYEATAVRLFEALRTLRCAVLIVDHVSKGTIAAARESGDRRVSPYGSIMTENRAGNTWLLESDGEEGAEHYSLSLSHQKVNRGRREERHAYRVDHVNDDGRMISVTYTSERYVEAFPGKATLGERITRSLLTAPAGRMSPKELAEELDVSPGSIKPTLRRMKAASKVIQFSDFTYGVAREATP